jgi:hypothetical protein
MPGKRDRDSIVFEYSQQDCLLSRLLQVQEVRASHLPNIPAGLDQAAKLDQARPKPILTRAWILLKHSVFGKRSDNAVHRAFIDKAFRMRIARSTAGTIVVIGKWVAARLFSIENDGLHIELSRKSIPESIPYRGMPSEGATIHSECNELHSSRCSCPVQLRSGSKGE